MRTLRVEKKMSNRAAAALAAQIADDTWYDVVVDEDCKAIKPDGSTLFIFRKNVLSAGSAKAAYSNLRAAAKQTRNRGASAGTVEVEQIQNEGQGAWISREGGGVRYKLIKKDGTLSNTSMAMNVTSGIIGYYDRTVRTPYCRTTAYTLDHPERFSESIPFIHEINEIFREEMPARYQNQSSMVAKTSPDFCIPGTVFTTVTVNLNWQTAVHQDAGDLKEGFGVMTALCAGEFVGCYLCFPQYRVAVNMRTLDVILADVHEWHCNTPFHSGSGNYERLSFVLYYREKMHQCGSNDQELALARKRKKGDAMY